MNKSNILVVTFLVLSLTVLPLFSSEAFANPSEADLTFKYRSNGTLAVNVKLDSEVTSRCIARHRSSLYFEGDEIGDQGVLRRATHSRVLTKGRKSTSLRAFGLPGVTQKNGNDPIIAVQVRLVCSGEDEDITSNIEARFVRCGNGVKRVSLLSYLNTLKRKLAVSR